MRHRQTHGREPRALIDHPSYHLPQGQFPCTCGRMVKKLEPGLTVEFMPSPSSMLRVACCPLPQAYSTPIEDGTGGGCKAYGLEDIVGVYHRLSRSALTAT